MNRKWLVRLGIGLVVVVGGLAGVALLFDSTESTTSEYDQQLKAAALRLDSDYLQPLRQTDASGCRFVRAGTDDLVCRQFLSKLQELQPALAREGETIRDLLNEPPADLDEDYPLATWQNMADMLEATWQSNQRLIEGWESADQGKWDQEWQRREELQDQFSEAFGAP